jgi:hypothetical protein
MDKKTSMYLRVLRVARARDLIEMYYNEIQSRFYEIQ